jgi:hypothetical protein
MVDGLTERYDDQTDAAGISFMRADILTSAISQNGHVGLPANFVILRGFTVGLFVLSIRNVKHK